MDKTVTLGVYPDEGRLHLEDGAAFLGEVVDLVFTGYKPKAGMTLRVTVFDFDGVTPIADNSVDPHKLDLRGELLRKRFHDQSAKTFTVFACLLDSEGVNVGEVSARGIITIKWSPFVWDAATGKPATLRGPQGDKGEEIERVEDLGFGEDGSALYAIVTTGGRRFILRSPKGDPSSTIYVAERDATGQRTGYWHTIGVRQNKHGEWVVSIDQERIDNPSDANEYVTRLGDVIIENVKTFTSSPIVPTPQAGDSSQKAATTAFVGAAMKDVEDKATAAQEAAQEAAKAAAQAAEQAAASVIAAIYPVGSIYIGATESSTDTCPIAALVGTWQKIEGRYLLASGQLVEGETYAAGAEVGAALPTPPNHTHKYEDVTANVTAAGGVTAGSVLKSKTPVLPNPSTAGAEWGADTIYGKSSTVRPKAYVVNVWKRIA